MNPIKFTEPDELHGVRALLTIIQGLRERLNADIRLHEEDLDHSHGLLCCIIQIFRESLLAPQILDLATATIISTVETLIEHDAISYVFRLLVHMLVNEINHSDLWFRALREKPLILTQLGLELSKRHRAHIQMLKVTCSRHEPSNLLDIRYFRLEQEMIIEIFDVMLCSSENY